MSKRQHPTTGEPSSTHSSASQRNLRGYVQPNNVKTYAVERTQGGARDA